MKNFFTLLIILFSLNLLAQETLEISQANLASAHLEASPVFFTNFDLGPGYKITDEAIPTIFSSGLWYSALTPDSQIYVGASTYGFEPASIQMSHGPVSSNYDDDYDAIYGVLNFLTATDVEDHLSNWDTPGYVVPEAILNYPANGRTEFGESAILAPFLDQNGNNIYEPAMGDYPIIRGNQCATWIIHDDTSLGATRANIEIIIQAYTVESVNQNVSSTLFMSTTFQNTSDATYELRTGVWNDWNLGNYLDDHIGCNPDANFFYVYNGDSFDEETPFGPGFEESLAAQGTVILNRSLDGHMTYQNGLFPINGNPNFEAEFHAYLNSSFLTGISLQDGLSNVYGLPDDFEMNPNYTSFIHYSYPWETGDDVLNAVVTQSPSSDQIALGSMDIGYFGPGDRVCLDFAYVSAQKTAFEPQWQEIMRLEENINQVQAHYDTQGHECIDAKVPLNVMNEASPTFNMFPNPTSGNLIMDLSTTQNAALKIYNQLGQCVLEQMTFSGETVDVTPLASGVYMVQVDGYRPQRLIKQ